MAVKKIPSVGFRVSAGIVLILFMPAILFAETVGVFFNGAVPQDSFAAGDVKSALESRGYTADMQTLSSLSVSYTSKKVVIAAASNTAASAVLTAQGGASPTDLGAQAYALRVTITPQPSYWALGGDATGSMYGGLDIAESIRQSDLPSIAEGIHSPYIAQRGIKYNIPLDARTPSYTDAGTSGQANIEDVWDINYWHEYLDAMARYRLNNINIWNLSPFPSMCKVPEFPNAALNDVYKTTTLLFPDGDGSEMSTSTSLAHLVKVKTITIDQKIAFWKDVMQYAADRA